MSIRKKIGELVSGSNTRIENSCVQDPQTKQIHCERRRVFEDGTKQILAVEDWQISAPPECKGIVSHMEEFDEGQLEKLEKWSGPRIRTKCRSVQNKPADY